MRKQDSCIGLKTGEWAGRARSRTMTGVTLHINLDGKILFIKCSKDGSTTIGLTNLHDSSFFSVRKSGPLNQSILHSTYSEIRLRLILLNNPSWRHVIPLLIKATSYLPHNVRFWVNLQENLVFGECSFSNVLIIKRNCEHQSYAWNSVQLLKEFFKKLCIVL